MEQRIRSTDQYSGLLSGTKTNEEANASGVSWPAVIAGAFATAALSLILLALGTGLGLSSVSPWSNAGASASTLGSGAIVWLIVMEVLSSALGGYLAGRLRTKWASIHTDEVYFRDTAHGFLAWCTALVVTAAFLGAAATSMVGASAPATSHSASVPSESADPNAYFVDTLFRTDASKTGTASEPMLSESGVIFANWLRQGSLSSADKAYLDQLVAERTGLSTGDADRRVSEVFANAQQAADVARKAIARSMLWTFLALLIGAFCASFSATIGGRQRDRVVTI